MKLSNAFFMILICCTMVSACYNMSDYPKLRDVPTDVKPSLTFKDAQKELTEMEQERNRQKAKP